MSDKKHNIVRYEMPKGVQDLILDVSEITALSLEGGFMLNIIVGGACLSLCYYVKEIHADLSQRILANGYDKVIL